MQEELDSMSKVFLFPEDDNLKSSTRKGKIKVLEPSYTLLDHDEEEDFEEGEGEAHSSLEEEQSSLGTLLQSALVLRLLFLLGLGLALIFGFVIVLGFALFVGLTILTFFQTPSFYQTAYLLGKIYLQSLVVVLSCLVGVISPPLGLSILMACMIIKEIKVR